MKISSVCNILGHDLEVIPAKYEDRETSYTIAGIPRATVRVKISKGQILCKRKGCEFHNEVWREERAEQEAKDAKFEKTFWRSYLWSDTKDFFKIVFWVAFWLLVLGFFVYFLIVYPDIKVCSTYHTNFGLETVWNFWTGCMIHSEKFGWIPADQFFQIINLNVP